MPRARPGKDDFAIHIDGSCLSASHTINDASMNGVDPHAQVEEHETSLSASEEAGYDSLLDNEHIIDENSQMSERETSAAAHSESPEVANTSVAEQTLPDTGEDLQGQEETQEASFASDILPTTEEDLTGEQPSSRPSSTIDRKASGRTDALIHAAALAVVDQIERHREDHDEEGRESALSSAINNRSYAGESEASYITDQDVSRLELNMTSLSESRRESCLSGSQQSNRRQTDHDDRGGDSSSHHEAESEVFSDRSPRSSLGSFEGSASQYRLSKNFNDDARHKEEDPVSMLEDDDKEDVQTQHTRSPRISDIFQYDHEDFVPTVRGTRLPFRTPSDVRALQMSSPTPSAYGGSPRSSKRPHNTQGFPTISRLGSPSVRGSSNYSPKTKTTPSRLKPRKNTPPLVLLHATILPLRWPWGDVLEHATSDELTSEAKNLREAWRYLHDRLGDTVCERGILLPHPQGDYEVLEERLLEALELPVRRRARILECGHYLGPSNEMSLLEEELDEDENEEFERNCRKSSMHSRQSGRLSTSLAQQQQTHWCKTCHHDIKYETLGAGRVFRVKVYASNGLMKAGAWSACWKEMERVDVEIEPIVEPRVQDELERLDVKQHEAAQREADEMEAAEAAAELGQPMLVENEHDRDHYDKHDDHPQSDDFAGAPPTPAENFGHGSPHSPSPDSTVSRHDQDVERRIRDEARMREIYGETPQPQPQPEQQPSPQDAPATESPFNGPPPMPRSPSEEALARRDARRASSSTLQSASLGELLLEAIRVMLQDKKNVALVLLSLLVVFMAVKPASNTVGGPGNHMDDWHGQFANRNAETVVPESPSVDVAVEPRGPTAPSAREEPQEAAPVAEEVVKIDTVDTIDPANDPCQSAAAADANDKPEQKVAEEAPEPLTTREIVRLVETITETETVKAVVTETEAAEPHSSATQAAVEEAIPEDSSDDLDQEVIDSLEQPASDGLKMQAPEIHVTEELVDSETGAIDSSEGLGLSEQGGEQEASDLRSEL